MKVPCAEPLTDDMKRCIIREDHMEKILKANYPQEGVFGFSPAQMFLVIYVSFSVKC